jgi:hypothetical protein
MNIVYTVSIAGQPIKHFLDPVEANNFNNMINMQHQIREHNFMCIEKMLESSSFVEANEVLNYIMRK